LTPTVRTTLVHAIPAFRIAKKPTLTHKTFAINYRWRAGFLPVYILPQANSLSFNFKHSKESIESKSYEF
jgi:hypothetical protein